MIMVIMYSVSFNSIRKFKTKSASGILYHFDQFGSLRPCYALHTCRNFDFGTLQKCPLHPFFFSADATGRFEKQMIITMDRLVRWIRHLARTTVTSVTFRQFEMARYPLLPNCQWSKWDPVHRSRYPSKLIEPSSTNIVFPKILPALLYSVPTSFVSLLRSHAISRRDGDRKVFLCFGSIKIFTAQPSSYGSEEKGRLLVARCKETTVGWNLETSRVLK